MQPPRVRTPRIDFSSTATLRLIILNATAVLTTLMLMRIATLMVTDSDESVIPGFIQLITEPLVWPFRFLPVLGATVTGEVTVIDFIITPVIALLGLLITGILTGWRDSGNTSRRYPLLGR